MSKQIKERKCSVRTHMGILFIQKKQWDDVICRKWIELMEKIETWKKKYGILSFICGIQILKTT